LAKGSEKMQSPPPGWGRERVRVIGLSCVLCSPPTLLLPHKGGGNDSGVIFAPKVAKRETASC